MFFGLIHLMWFVFVLKMGCLGFGKNSGPNFQQQRSDGAQASNDSSSQTLDELAPDYPPSYSVTVTRRGLEPQLGNPGSSDIIISANPFGGLSTAVPVDPRWDDPPAYSEIQLTEEEGKLPKV